MNTVIKNNKLARIDTYLFYKCHEFSNDPVKQASVWISKTGDGYLYFAISLLLYWVGGEIGKAFFLAALMGFAIELPIYLGLKKAFKRNRPFDKLTNFSSYIAPSDKFSMPSGHTAAAFVFATLVMYFYPQFTDLVIVWALLVGMARILLGVHFPGDIIAGGLLGFASAQVALTIYVTQL